MIEIKNAGFSYENSLSGETLKNISISIPSGQIVLLCGESGSGKTTFSRIINGLIPCYYEGKLTGKVIVDGTDTSDIQLHSLSDKVGSVFQNPKSQFYTMLTDTEIVFACENIGMEKSEILRRFEKNVREFRLEKLLGKSVSELSGGEKQKIACASVSMLSPDIMVLDEPTSNLDISAIRELRDIIVKWKLAGKTVIIAEHRLWWAKDFADRVILFDNGSIAEDIPAKLFFNRSAEELHSKGLRCFCNFTPLKSVTKASEKQYTISSFRFSRKDFILNISELKIPKGSVVAVLGNNGAGKSTFARCLCGLESRCRASISDGEKTYSGRKLSRLIYMVFQDVNHQLFSESVLEDVTLGLDLSDEEKRQTAENVLKSMELFEYKDAHPMSLSGGQKQRLAIAGAIAANKELIIYDEPTSGLDYKNMLRAAENINRLSKMGKTQFIITHDPELAEKCCDSFLFFENGSITDFGTWSDEAVQNLKKYFSV